jgi:hypothetical protein
MIIIFLVHDAVKGHKIKHYRYLLNILLILYYSMSTRTELTDTAYDISKVLGKDADFLYDTIETYIKDAQEANKTELVKVWQTIKEDRKRQMHLLKEALEREIHES